MNNRPANSSRFNLSDQGADALAGSVELLDRLIAFARSQGNEQLLGMAERLESLGWSALTPEQIQLLLAGFQDKLQGGGAGAEAPLQLAQAELAAIGVPEITASDASVSTLPRSEPLTKMAPVNANAQVVGSDMQKIADLHSDLRFALLGAGVDESKAELAITAPMIPQTALSLASITSVFDAPGFVTARKVSAYEGGQSLDVPVLSQEPDVTVITSIPAAVISGDTSNSLTETGAVLSTSGTLNASTSSFVARTGVAGSNGLGTFSINSAGAWTYATNSAHNEFVGGTDYTDSITVASADGTTQVITVTIRGTNDAAVISGDSTASLTETGAVLSTSGTLSASDIDSAATFVARTGVAGSNGLGTFSINSAGAWTYTTNSAHSEFLAGTDYTDSITVASADGTTQLITVTMRGVNDAATFSGNSSASVTEDSASYIKTGTLIVTDADSATSVTAQVASAGLYGTFSINSAGAWSYTADNALLQSLGGSTATATDTFTVVTADGTTRDIVVTLNGVNDAATFSGNSSANLTESGAVLSTSGTLIASDVDSATSFVARTGVTGSNNYGTFSINSAGEWTYATNSAHTEFVAGTDYTDSFTVASADGTTQDITVTISGSNGNPVYSVQADVAAVTEGNLGDPGGDYTEVTFTVHRVAPVDQVGPVQADSIAWSVDTSGVDSVSAEDVYPDDLIGSVYFAEDALTATVTVRILRDILPEADESLTLLLGASTYGINDGAATSSSTTVMDDDAAVGFSVASLMVVEGAPMTFRVTRLSGFGDALTLDYDLFSSGEGISSLPDDGVGQVSFSSTDESVDITVGTRDDNFVNSDQRFYLTLSGGSSGIRIANNTAQGTVTSNDALISIDSITPGLVVDGLVTYTVTLTRTGALNFEHSVSWSVAGSGESPAQTSDFILPVYQRVTFAANNILSAVSDQQTFEFQGRPGLIVEGSRSFVVSLDTPSAEDHVVLGVDTVFANIVPNGVSVSVVPVSTGFLEGTTDNPHAHTFELRLSAAATEDIELAWSVVPYNTGTSADADEDDFGGPFVTRENVTILAGETSVQIRVTPTVDSDVESPEKFYVQVALVSGPAGVVVPRAVGSILNDDALLGFGEPTFESNEGATGSSGTLVVSVVREGFNRSTVSAGWHVELIDASADNAEAAANDFASGQNALGLPSGLPSGRIELFPGALRGEIRIVMAGDNLLENSEKFRVVLDDPGAGTQLKADATVSEATILNDDAVFQMHSTVPSHAEGSGTPSYLTITVDRVGDTRTAASVTWSASGTGTNPTNSTDFNGALSGTLFFAKDAASATISMAVRVDDVQEENETLTVTLTGTTSAAHTISRDPALLSSVATLTNDDDTVQFLTTTLSQTEDAASAHALRTFNYLLTREGDTTKETTVAWHLDLPSGALRASASDFVATSGFVTFLAHETTATIQVQPVNDKVVEGDEAFTLRLDTPASGSGTKLGTLSSAAGILLNDDVTISATLVSADYEGSGDTTYLYTLTRTGDTTNQASSIDWSVAGAQIVQPDGMGGSVLVADALGVGEFSAVSSVGGSTLQWDAGDSTSRTITVTVHGDQVAEGDEAFQLTINKTADSADNSNLLGNGLMGVVHDDDATLSIAAVSGPQFEGSLADAAKELVYRITRTGDLSSTITADLSVSGASGVSGPSSVTFAPDLSQSITLHYDDGRADQVIPIQGGVQEVEVTFTVAGDDTLETDEALLVTLSNALASDGHTVVVGVAQASVTIANDDDRIDVAASSTVAEGDSGDVPLTFTLTRSGDTSKETTVKWQIVGQGLVVVNADDFAPGQENVSQVPNNGMPSGVVTFDATITEQTITVYISGDTTIEASEGLALQLSVTAGNTETSDTLVTLVADDVGYNAIARHSEVVEGNHALEPRYMTFDVVRAGGTTDKTVHWAVSGVNSDDIIGDLFGDITFEGDASGAVVRLEIKQDSLVDVDKTATLEITDETGVLATASSVLADDDASLTITASEATITEGTYDETDEAAVPYKVVSFTVIREGNTAQTSTVGWSVNGAGITAADFVGGVLPTGAVTFTATETNKTITLQVLSDSLGEDDDVLTLNLGAPDEGTSNLVSSAQTTVTNDDAMVTMTTTLVEHVEGDGGATLYEFTLTRTGYLNQISTVHWSLENSYGISFNDFSTNFYVSGHDGNSWWQRMPNGDVTFAANTDSQATSDTQTFTVSVNADTSVSYNGGYNYNHWYNWASSRLEGDEAFGVSLSNASLGTSTQGTARGTVLNDDVKIQVVDIHTYLPEGLGGADADPTQGGDQTGISHSITLQRMGDASRAVSIEWYVDNAVLEQMQPGQASSGVITWAVGDSDNKVITFTPIADDVVESDYLFYLKVRPVTVNSHASAEDQAIQQAQRDSAALIDEIGFQKGTNTVYAVPFDSSDWVNDSNSGYITLGTFNVKRDESGIWVSNEVITGYDNYTSLQTGISQQYGGADSWDSSWGYQANGVNSINYNQNDAENLEGSIGTATAASDYSSVVPGSLTFTAVNQTQHITVGITDNSTYETSEGFGVFLSNASGATIVTEQATTTILDNDNPNPDFQLKVQGSTAIEGIDSAATFTVDLGKALTQDNQFTVNFNGGTSARQANPDNQAGDFGQYFDYSTDGGATWKTNAPVFEFEVNAAAKPVDDQLVVTYQFNTNNGNNFSQWLDFSDLKASAGYMVGGAANPNNIGNDWGWTDAVDSNNNYVGKHATIWIPVRADAVIDANGLSLSFAGLDGKMSGAFVDVASLSDNVSDANVAAIQYFSDKFGRNSPSAIQSYFHQYDASNSSSADVKLLEFEILWDDNQAHNSYGDLSNTDLTWHINGLDAALVVAPQNGSVWSNLKVIQDLTLVAGESSLNADIALGSQASFYTYNNLSAVDLLQPAHLSPSFTVASDVTDADGIRTVTVDVTRTDASVDDALSYHLNISELKDAAFLSGSAARDGSVNFAAGVATQSLVFTFSAIPLEVVPNVTRDVHVIVDSAGAAGVQAYIDTNSDGVLQSSEAVHGNLAFSNGDDLVNLALNHVTVTFNDMPSEALNFSGFGGDDRLEINLSELGANGWKVGTVTDVSVSGYYNSNNGENYFACSENSLSGRTVRGDNFDVTLNATASSGSHCVQFHGSKNGSWENYTIATFSGRSSALANIDGQGRFMQQVAFVTNPTVYVVVDHFGNTDAVGAFMDTNADGVLQDSEAVDANRAFSALGQDLLGLEHNQVVVHFNAVADHVLDFSGFGKDDRVELDVQALKSNGFDQIGSTLSHSAYYGQIIQNSSVNSCQQLGFEGAGQLTALANRQYQGSSDTYTANVLKIQSQSDNWANLADFGTGNCSSGNDIIDGNGGLMARVSFVNVGGVAAQNIHVVVDHYGVDGAVGAFIDTNADGVLQASEAVTANRAFTSELIVADNGDESWVRHDLVNLAANHVTIQFNDAPDADQELNFMGFGTDDKVQINLSEFDRNGWVLGAASSSSLNANNCYSNNHITYAYSRLDQSGDTRNGDGYSFSVTAFRGINEQTAILQVAGDRHTGTGGTQSRCSQLATFGNFSNANPLIDGNGSFMKQVSFVQNPTIHVVVEASGAYIDTDADGVLDASEAVDANLAFFTGCLEETPGNWSWVKEDYVDLAHNQVIIKFNDGPDNALNFSGFGRDDRIEIDLSAMRANGFNINPDNLTDHSLNHWANSCSNYRYSSRKGVSGSLQGSDFSVELKANRSGSYANTNRLRLSISTSTNSNNHSHCTTLATFGRGTNSFNQIIDGNLGLMNRISFVQSDVMQVLIEADGGWIDTNKNGALDASEKVDANRAFDFNVAPGQSNALVDFDHHKVVVHFNDAPTQALDLSKFGADDRIEIDRTSLGLNGWQGALNSDSNSSSNSNTRSNGQADGYKCLSCSGSAISEQALRDSVHNSMRLLSQTTNSASRSALLADFGDNANIIDGDYGLQNKVSFVKHTLFVVVESDGAYLDTNANGIHDLTETALAFDASTGLDLINLDRNKVVVQFNNAPTVALDFSGFNWNDRIEIDRAALALNGWDANFQDTDSSSSSWTANNFNGSHYKQVSVSDSNSNCTTLRVAAQRRSSDNDLTANKLVLWANNRTAVLANFGTTVNGYSCVSNGSALYSGFSNSVGNFDRVSFVNPYISGFDNGTAVTPSQDGSVNSNGMTSSETITVGAGVESILIKVPLVNDTTDESVEKITVNVTHESGGDSFLVPSQSASTTLVDNDSPQLTLGANELFDDTLQQNYLFQTIDINNRNNDTPSVGFSGGYYSNSLQNNAGSTQEMTVTLRFKGDWEVVAISEDMGQTGQNYSQPGVPMTHTNALHNSAPAFRVLSGGVAELVDGVATGYTLYDLTVAAGTKQILMRSAITTDQAASLSAQDMLTGYTDGNDEDVAAPLPMTATVTHVAPVIVVRNTTVDERAGSVSIDVVVVGGDIHQGQSVSVDYQTVDGQWVDRTFVFSREFATVGTQTATWSVSALTNGATSTTGQLVDGDGYATYVNGYFGQSVIGTVSPDDFVILGDQSANLLTGMPTGTVTFLDGQKEAYVTIRVRADNVGESPEDFAVVLTGVDTGVQKLANPNGPLSYAALGYAGYAKIVNDDQVFSIKGAVFNEHADSITYNNNGVLSSGDNNGMAVAGTPAGMFAPTGYTLHQFVVTREGDHTAAASVDWVIQVKGADGSAHQAEVADFLTGITPYGVTWADSAVDGVLSSVGQPVTFAAGEWQKVVTIAVSDDLIAEDAEQFKVVLNNPLPLPGNEGLPGVSQTRGSADFLIGDNDGAKVSVALSWQVPDVVELVGGIPVTVDNDMLLDAATGLPMVVEGTEIEPSATAGNDRQLVMTFTRSVADLTSSQAFFQIDMTQTAHRGANSLTLAEGNVVLTKQYDGSSWWRGTVNFVAGATSARVVFNIEDDNLVEGDNRVKVTLFDAEHMPLATGSTNHYYNYRNQDLQDTTGIGYVAAMPDWNTTQRDPSLYTAEAVVKNDDVRLWLDRFITPNNYNDSSNHRALSMTPYEGDSPMGLGVAIDQMASSDNSNLELIFARAGRQDNDIQLNWQVVLNGSAEASDFNSDYWVDVNGDPTLVLEDVFSIQGSLILAGTDSDTQATSAGNYDTVPLTIENLFSPDRTVENNEYFQLVFNSTDEANVKFTFDWFNEGRGTHYDYDWNGTDRTGQSSMTVDMTLVNDDVKYSIAPSTDGRVGEGALGAANNQVQFEVSRAIDATQSAGYAIESSVYWRVVSLGTDHSVGATDFANPGGIYEFDEITGLPFGQVHFNPIYVDVWNEAGGYNERFIRNDLPVPDLSDILQTITLFVRGDSVVEYGENFTVELYSPSYGYVDQTAASASGIIVNDDTGIVFENISVDEGDSGVTTVVASVTRIGDLTGTSSMDWGKYNIDTNATDFDTTGLSGSITMTDTSGVVGAMIDGYGEQTQSVTLNIQGDTTVEGDEKFQLFLSSFVGVSEQRKTTSTVTVVNDDTVFSVVADAAFGANSYDEGSDLLAAPAGTYHYLVTRSVDTPQTQTVVWSVTAAGGRSRIDDSDFEDGLPTGTVTFAPGELSQAISFDFVLMDSNPEADEVFMVQVTALGTGADGDTVAGEGAIGIVLNDDAAVFIGDTQPVKQIEGSATSDPKLYSFDVVRSGPSVTDSSVDWTIYLSGDGNNVDGLASFDDFDLTVPGSQGTYDESTHTISGTVHFTVNNYENQTVRVGLSVDTTEEMTESFSIELSNPTGSTALVSGDASAMTGKIADDDYTLTVAETSLSPFTEGDSNSNYSFTVTRVGAADLPATVSWHLDFTGTEGSANAADFVATSGTFTLPAGAVDYTFSVPVRGDVQLESTESFALVLDYNRNNGTLGQALSSGTLVDDDEAFSILTFDGIILPTIEGASSGGGDVLFSIMRGGNTSGTSSVSYSISGSGLHAVSTSGDSNDFAGAITGVVEFIEGQTSNDVTVALAGDDVAEFDEGYTVTLINAGPGSSINSASASGTIVNDDMGYSVTADVTTVTEGDSTGGAITFTFTRTADVTTLQSNTFVNWQLGTANGETSGALQSEDFVDGYLNGWVNFDQGETSKTITIQLTGDDVVEQATTLRLSLNVSDGVPGTVINGSGVVDVTVVDDDDQLSLSALETLASPEGNISDGTSRVYHFQVSRTGSSIGISTVEWSVVGSGNYALADEEILSVNGVARTSVDGVLVPLVGTLTFADGDMSAQSIDVEVSIDAVGEFNESFSVGIDNTSYGSSLGVNTLTHTVQNDDPALQLTMARSSFREGNEGSDAAITFTVTRTGSLLGTSSATWAIEAGASGDVVNEADFGGFLPSGVVNFAIGERVKTITVLTQGDNIREVDEAFRVVLSAPSTGTSIIGISSLDATLQNDDVGVSISSLTEPVLEGPSGADVEFEFELSAEGSNRANSVRVTWHVEGVSTSPSMNPMNSADFVGNTMPTGIETFDLSSGSGTTRFSVWVAGDNMFGLSEQFKVVIDTVDAFDSAGGVLGASVTVGEAMGTTLADDTLIGLRQETHTVVEGDSGYNEVRFYVDVLESFDGRPVLDAVRVAYHLSGDVNASDFVDGVTSSTDTALSHDDNGYYIALNVKGDTAIESTERYVMHLDSANMDTPYGGNVEIARQGVKTSGEIVGDDYGISLVTTNMTQSEDRARFVFDVLRSGPVDKSMDVIYQLGVPDLGDGEYGVSANDFMGTTSASLHFDAGQTMARFVLEAYHDFAVEANERFAVTATVTKVDDIAVNTIEVTDNQFAYVQGWVNNDDGALPVPYTPDPLYSDLDTLHPLTVG